MDDNNEFELRNVSEELIDTYLDSCMKNTDMCTCNRCRADVRAYALNTFPPHYVVTDFGDLITRTMSLSVQFKTDILTAIMQGIKLVMEKPRCGNNPKSIPKDIY